MKKRLILLSMCFLFSITDLFSIDIESLDTLVYLNEIKFHSDLEKEAFLEYFDGEENDFLKLFIAKDGKITNTEYLKYLTNFNKYVSILKTDKNSTKPNKKKVKYYFKRIHDDYLVKYERIIFFPNIFKNGYYNCVTGSIFYSLIFEELKLPYTIKVSPVHTYVVAYPNRESIIVETTAPLKGYFVFNESFKQNYVKYLKDNKLISIQEYNSSSADLLFDKYYFKEKDITLKEMVGIQYSNDAIEKIQNQKFEEAFYELEKAYLFYPSDEIVYLLYYCAAMVIDMQDFSDLKYVDFLYKIARYKRYGINREQIVGEFGRITQNQLNYKGQYDLYDEIFVKLYNNLEDENTKKEISFIYNYEKAKLFIRNEKSVKAFSHIEEALKIRPKHLDLQTMFLYALANKYEPSDFNDENLNKIESYGEKIPVLKDNSIYCDMVCDAYIYIAIQNYEEGNLDKAVKYHSKFTEYINNNSDYTNYEYNVSRLYSSAAVYYFRKGYTKKAKSIILEGLKLVPESYELKQRLKVFN